MAMIETGIPARRRPGVHRMKNHSLNTDMTPMVDLGFLLIAFFVITAELSRPKAADLFLPKEGIDMPVPESASLTLLLGKAPAVYWYEGKWEDAVAANRIFKTNFSAQQGLREIIRSKQAELDRHPSFKNGRDELMLMIKPGNEAAYSTVVDALDEVLIHAVKKYVLVKPATAELKWLEEQP